ncbi:glycoside hydrolase family 3 protein [Luteipulveratus flavus]|uniref:beta-glucosidase n=1 Tax=Luteipulveratus flavus TaxID=3031728 RepID=A0ABT6C2Q9_9MICO|nr:glycoside hydrolase family 3 protein [Luteipulveratus sp. YIM 133296]MDF8262945.1 glycoside hydrolase family 3 protein [Luteipulveratus sp. YIM 133296]
MHHHPTGKLALSLALVVAASAPVAAPAIAQAPDRAPTAGAQAALPYQNPALPIPQRVADLLGRMNLDEKIGQMTQAERGAIDSDPSKIATAHLGSVLSGGGSVPSQNTPTAWADMVDRYQRAAMSSRLKIPIIYGVDSVHGHGNLVGATIFPHNVGVGATRDPSLARRAAAVTAQETRATGPQWVFSPCVCVARDDRWGRSYEAYGETPALVQSMETAIRGFQGGPGGLASPEHVLSTAKHFAGDGLTTYGTGSNDKTSGNYAIDQGVDQVDRATFDRLALAPYVPAIKQYDVGTVMPSYSDVDWTEDGLGNRINMHANRSLITGWLKNTQGFDGFVISDYEGIHHIKPETYTYDQQVVAGVNAGTDMFMEPYDYANFQTSLKSAVTSGKVPMARVDDAVSRILTKKFELGLFEHPYTDRTHTGEVGSAQHRALARTVAAKSQVLLKNKPGVLPLNGGRPVYVAGGSADSMENQTGGWTISWQGGNGAVPGTTILGGIKANARSVTYSKDASAPVPKGAVGVVVVGETPYAEGFGDVGSAPWSDNGVARPAQTMRLSASDSKAVDTVCAATQTCVVLVVSGRPMIIPPAQLRKIDGLVASWLPGSEGTGVTDPLFGRTGYSGRLPVTWPKSLNQEPINVGDRFYDPQYAYGWGLTTRARG